jgi:uncharacterized repeat protein (TIGR02059 family)
MSNYYNISLTEDYHNVTQPGRNAFILINSSDSLLINSSDQLAASLGLDYYNSALTEDYYEIVKGPVIQSAEVGSVDDNDLVITFSKNLNTSITPNVNDFVVNDGAVNKVTSVSISGATVTLVLTNDVGIGATVVVSYTPAECIKR